MSSLIKTAADLARAYQRLTSTARLADYTASRLPNNLKSIGPLSKMASGSGRIPFSLGDELVVKTARMPRGMMENSMEGDWVAPVPEAVWKSDDDAIAVVKRLAPMTAKQHPEAWKQISALQKAIGYQNNPRYDVKVQAALEELDWQDLLNYDPLWGDVVKRNVGMEGAKPMLLDAGILNRNILNPAEVSGTISPAEWAQYRREVLRAKSNFAQGGQVKPKYNAQNPMDHGQRRAPTQERIRQVTSDWDAMKKGARNWAPDVAGFFLGDIPDALTYVARRAANVQGEQSIPSLGAGNAVRRAVHDLQAQFGLEDKFVPPSGQVVGPVYEPSTLEQVTQFANPLAFVNPTSATKTAGRGAAELIARAVQSEGPLARMATAGFRPMYVIKSKGGNWPIGSVEDALSSVKRGAHFGPGPAEIIPGSPTEAINSWIDKALAKYVKNQMATPEDPIRALAEQGTLHFAPDWVPEGGFSRGQAAGITGGAQGRRLGKEKLAQDWEDLSDQGLDQARAEELMHLRNKNPWLEKVPGETPVYGFPPQLEQSLGFDHLIDELSNSINPESGLPRHLLFPADRLEKVSVPQAVQRVSDINKWRAEQKVLADQARANNAATVLHKEYPEKGMRWVQLAHPEAEKSPEAKAALADALKYEGDTMGHCVGRYCDDVASGQSQIFSLRDAKGEPHATIEVEPYRGQAPKDDDGNYLENVPSRIVQIKGKLNRAPNPEYLPFVQDFVRSGQWSDVGELQNAGLRRSRDIWNDLEQQRIREAGKEFGTYLSPEEVKAINSEVWPGDPVYNFAQGGSVAPNKIETLGQLRAIMATLHKDSAHA